MDKINILIVSSSGLGKTGVPNVILQVVKVLHPFANIDIVVFNDDDYYSREVKKYNAEIIKIDLREPKGRLSRFFWRVFREHFIIRRSFNSIFKSKHYNAVHSFKEYDSAFIFETAYKNHIKNRIIHCNNEVKQPINIISRFLFLRKAYLVNKFTTGVIGVSNECAKKSYPRLKYDVLFNSFNESKFVMPTQSFNNSKKLILVQVATFSSRKNQLFTIDVFNEITKRYSDSVLYLVGTEVEPGYLNKVNSKIQNLSLKSMVYVIDGLSDFSKIFGMPCFFLLPSLSEAAPISLVEAQASGIYCFASSYITKDVDCGGVKYLDLKVNIWADNILDAFNKGKYVRTFYDVDKFSSTAFSKKLLTIYKEHSIL